MKSPLRSRIASKMTTTGAFDLKSHRARKEKLLCLLREQDLLAEELQQIPIRSLTALDGTGSVLYAKSYFKAPKDLPR